MRSHRVQLVHDVPIGRLEDAVDHVDDEVLEAVEELVVREERALGLDMRVPAREATPKSSRNVGGVVVARRECEEECSGSSWRGALGEVAARARLLGAVGARDAEAVAHCRDGSLEVQLRALRQVRVLVEVLQLEQCAPALHLRLHQRRRHHLRAQHANTLTYEYAIKHVSSKVQQIYFI